MSARIKKAVPIIGVSCLMLILIVSAFLVVPQRAASAMPELDREALAALSGCRAYIAERAFSTTLSGEVRAKVFGVPYTQTVSGSRTVNGSDFTSVFESSSAFVKASCIKSCESGAYSVRIGKYKKGRFYYSEPEVLSPPDYTARYGEPESGLCRYALDGNIVSARKIDDGEYCFTLDPYAAAALAREMSGLPSGDTPKFSGVELVLYTDGDRPLRTVCRETFTVDRFGGASCTAVREEVFAF